MASKFWKKKKKGGGHLHFWNAAQLFFFLFCTNPLAETQSIKNITFNSLKKNFNAWLVLQSISWPEGGKKKRNVLEKFSFLWMFTVLYLPFSCWKCTCFFTVLLQITKKILTERFFFIQGLPETPSLLLNCEPCDIWLFAKMVHAGSCCQWKYTKDVMAMTAVNRKLFTKTR